MRVDLRKPKSYGGTPISQMADDGPRLAGGYKNSSRTYQSDRAEPRLERPKANNDIYAQLAGASSPRWDSAQYDPKNSSSSSSYNKNAMSDIYDMANYMNNQERDNLLWTRQHFGPSVTGSESKSNSQTNIDQVRVNPLYLLDRKRDDELDLQRQRAAGDREAAQMRSNDLAWKNATDLKMNIEDNSTERSKATKDFQASLAQTEAQKRNAYLNMLGNLGQADNLFARYWG